MNEIGVIGPSHVVRLENTYLLGSLALTPDITFFGVGGMPVWHNDLENAVYKSPQTTLMIVGDYRFGNGYINTGNRANITGIDKESITKEIDIQCYRKVMTSLRHYENMPSKTMHYIFWNLAIREAKNKISGSYQLEDGSYQHPIWNLSDVEKSFDSTISLACLSSEQLITMCTDASNHPSFLGYVFLSKLINSLHLGKDAVCASVLYNESLSFIRSNFVTQEKSPGIVGKSILQRFLKSSQEWGLVKNSVNDPVGIRGLPGCLAKNREILIYISNIKYDDDFDKFCMDIDFLSSIISKHESSKVKLIFWDVYARCVFESRKSNNRNNAYIHVYKLLEANFKPFMIDLPYPGTIESFSLVELNRAGQPTYKMLNYLTENSPSYDHFSVNFAAKVRSMVGLT